MVVTVLPSLTLLSLSILVAQHSIRHDKFSSEQHLKRFRRLDWRGAYSETWSLAGLCDVAGNYTKFNGSRNNFLATAGHLQVACSKVRLHILLQNATSILTNYNCSTRSSIRTFAPKTSHVQILLKL